MPDPTGARVDITWYMRLRTPGGRTGRVQLSDVVRRTDDSIRLPEHVLRLAQAEYEHQQGHSQDYERMQERGGLGLMEIIALLADLAERHGAKPTRPRGATDA